MSNGKSKTLVWGSLGMPGRGLGATASAEAPRPPRPQSATILSGAVAPKAVAPEAVAPKPIAPEAVAPKAIALADVTLLAVDDGPTTTTPAISENHFEGAATLHAAELVPAYVEPQAAVAPPLRPIAGTIDMRAASTDVGMHDTVHADSGTAGASVRIVTSNETTSGSASIRSAMRTTVLPRLERVGEVPTLVLDGKARYEQSRKLGEGGMGEVIHANDNDIGRPVAVKRLRSEVASPATLARFVEEIRTVGKLEHPNIIPIHDVGLDGPGEYYFVMKYVDGETLESIIERLAAGDPTYHRRYGFEARVQIFRGILEAVAFAHSKGILHRDIKPANVMVGAYGEVILMDWGIAKHMGTGIEPTAPAEAANGSPPKEGRRGRAFETQVGALVGTPAYMSPEQARGEPLDARSDVYSLSVLFHELLSLGHYLDGKTTLEGVIAGVSKDEVPHAGSTNHAHQAVVPMDLSWYTKAGTSKDPQKRYPSVQAMLDRLDRRAQGDIPIECPCTLVKAANGRWSRFVDRHPFVIVAMLAGLVIGIAFGAIRMGMNGHG